MHVLLGRSRTSAYARWGKRVCDCVVAGLVLVGTAPIAAAVAIAIRIAMGSPILFRQQRPGLDGQLFEILKFRTMTTARGGDGLLLTDFERRTALGDFLRRTSLDELPQLINVLRGEMSMIGPRPLLIEYLPFYSARQSQRHSVRPGITGLAQVCGRNVTTWERRLALDTWYAAHVSARLDVLILGRTVRAIISGGGSIDEAWALGKFRGSRVEPDHSGQLESAPR